MKAPKCRLCKIEHWPREGCEFEGRTARKSSVKAKGSEAVHGAKSDHVESDASKTYPVQGREPMPSKFDRMKYQREYMREYRKRKRRVIA